jgi:hypothetical protein
MLRALFEGLADAFDSDLSIERIAARALRAADTSKAREFEPSDLHVSIRSVMQASNAAPVCATILATPLPWAPPNTSDDPDYVSHNSVKYSVELLGPEGLVSSDEVRLGLYGYVPHAAYGERTHPAEEVFLMLAGEAWWMRDNAPYLLHGPGERSYHPSMMPHGTRSGQSAFMSAYVWTGDISTENYAFTGGPARTEEPS